MAAAPFFLTNDPILQGNDNLDGTNLVLRGDGTGTDNAIAFRAVIDGAIP